MAFKRTLLAAGLLAGFMTLSSASAPGSRDSHEIRGDFLTVKIDFAGYYKLPLNPEAHASLQAEINKGGMDTCKGRDFAIDPIQYIRSGRPFTPPEVLEGLRARVFCKD